MTNKQKTQIINKLTKALQGKHEVEITSVKRGGIFNKCPHRGKPLEGESFEEVFGFSADDVSKVTTRTAIAGSEYQFNALYKEVNGKDYVSVNESKGKAKREFPANWVEGAEGILLETNNGKTVLRTYAIKGKHDVNATSLMLNGKPLTNEEVEKFSAYWKAPVPATKDKLFTFMTDIENIVSLKVDGKKVL